MISLTMNEYQIEERLHMTVDTAPRVQRRLIGRHKEQIADLRLLLTAIHLGRKVERLLLLVPIVSPKLDVVHHAFDTFVSVEQPFGSRRFQPLRQDVCQYMSRVPTILLQLNRKAY